MAQQVEEGWPLGLRPLNGRIGLARNPDTFSAGSVSFSTLLTASSPSSTYTTSDVDTQSSSSFFHDRSITLGSLIGIPSILDLSRRSTRRFTPDSTTDQRNSKCNKPWFFSLCSRLNTDAVNSTNTQPLGHFLRAERKAGVPQSNLRPIPYVPTPRSPFVDSAATLAVTGGWRPDQ